MTALLFVLPAVLLLILALWFPRLDAPLPPGWRVDRRFDWGRLRRGMLAWHSFGTKTVYLCWPFWPVTRWTRGHEAVHAWTRNSCDHPDGEACLMSGTNRDNWAEKRPDRLAGIWFAALRRGDWLCPDCRAGLESARNNFHTGGTKLSCTLSSILDRLRRNWGSIACIAVLAVILVLSVLLARAWPAGFRPVRNDYAKLVFLCEEVEGAFSYTIQLENAATGERCYSATDGPLVDFYVLGAGLDETAVRDKIAFVEFGKEYRVVSARVFGLGGDLLAEQLEASESFQFTVGTDLLRDFQEGLLVYGETAPAEEPSFLTVEPGWFSAVVAKSASAEPQNCRISFGPDAFVLDLALEPWEARAVVVDEGLLPYGRYTVRSDNPAVFVSTLQEKQADGAKPLVVN